MESLSHLLETPRKAFNEACAQLKMNPAVDESLRNQIATEPNAAETLHGFSRKESSTTLPSTSRRIAYLQVREQLVGEKVKKPAQMKFEQQIECAKSWADELRFIQSHRQLSAAEIQELNDAEFLQKDLKKKLKHRKTNAIYSKRNRDAKKKAQTCCKNHCKKTHVKDSLNINSPEDLRSSSSTSSIELLPSSFAKGQSPLSKTCQKNNFACPTCGFNLPNLELLASHLQTQHPQISPQPSSLFSQICKRSFSSAANRLRHMTEHLIANSSVTSCQQCSKQFKTMPDFQQHFLYNHSETLQRCNICCHVFTQISTFHDHLASHMTSELRYTCVACPNSIFRNLGSFESHVQLFHDKNESSNGNLKANLIGVSNYNYATTIAPGPSFKI